MGWQLKVIFGIVLVSMVLSAGCKGDQGEEGQLGPAGPPGPLGPVGPDGQDATSAQSYIGAAECGSCHEEIYERFRLTGHGNALSEVADSQPPVFPFADVTGGVSEPPAGYSWEDISYVIGGFGWMARYVDNDGYLITGDDTQFNYANETLDLPAGWVSYQAGETVPFDCAPCHTTGYAGQGHQDNREGIDGTWVFTGVQCEKCHGPGDLHAENPQGVRMVVDRSAQLCGHCHVREEAAVMNASDGFEEHNQQFSDLYNSRHFALSCVTCHDPHASARHEEPILNPNKGISQVCENCHWQQDAIQNVRKHLGVDCIDCHMPPMAKSATGDLDLFTGDIRSHQFAINTDPAADQFKLEGTQVMPYLTLTYACGQCHNGDYAAAEDLTVLAEAANGYHSLIPPSPTPTPTDTPTAVPEAEVTPTPEG